MKKIKQKDIAIAAGITPAFFNEILKAKKAPRWPKAKSIGEVTNTPPELWIEGSQEERQAAFDRLRVYCVVNANSYLAN